MNAFKRILPDIIAIVVFAVISFAYFCPTVTEGRILSQHDSVAGIGAGQEGKEYLSGPVNGPVGQTPSSAGCRRTRWHPATTRPTG